MILEFWEYIFIKSFVDLLYDSFIFSQFILLVSSFDWMILIYLHFNPPVKISFSYFLTFQLYNSLYLFPAPKCLLQTPKIFFRFFHLSEHNQEICTYLPTEKHIYSSYDCLAFHHFKVWSYFTLNTICQWFMFSFLIF